MPYLKLYTLVLISLLCFIGCSSPGVPEPIVVLENPETGERVRFFKEIPLKVPANYDESKHIADWTANQNANGFTELISPEEDRQQLAVLHEMNLAASKRGQRN